MLDNLREWLSDNLRYILLGLAVLLIIIIGVCIARLVGGSLSKKSDEGETTAAVTMSPSDEDSTDDYNDGNNSSVGTYLNLTEDDPSILLIVQEYYSAVASKDSATLATIVDPWNDSVESQTFNSNIESYDNITTYSEDGPVDGSYLVYVYCECKIPDIATEVPSLRQLFVTTNDDDELFRSDWSQYEDFVTEANKSADVQSLIEAVNERCLELAENDADLKEYLKTQGIGEEEETTEETTVSETSSTTSGTATATDGVNVRSEASTNGTILGTLYAGLEVNVLGTDGEWTHISYIDSNGNTIEGYCMSKYLDLSNDSSGGEADEASATNDSSDISL